MKLTKENYKQILPLKEQKLFNFLLEDFEELKTNNILLKKMYIDWQDFHNEYSPERTDPCPDYYAYYTLRSEDYDGEIIGEEMTISDLDSALLLLNDYEKYLKYVSTNN